MVQSTTIYIYISYIYIYYNMLCIFSRREHGPPNLSWILDLTTVSPSFHDRRSAGLRFAALHGLCAEFAEGMLLGTGHRVALGGRRDKPAHRISSVLVLNMDRGVFLLWWGKGC